MRGLIGSCACCGVVLTLSPSILRFSPPASTDCIFLLGIIRLPVANDFEPMMVSGTCARSGLLWTVRGSTGTVYVVALFAVYHQVVSCDRAVTVRRVLRHRHPRAAAS